MMRVGLLKSGLGWVDTVERLLLDPSPKSVSRSSRANPEAQEKPADSTTKETDSKQRSDGPDTSSLTAFLLSLLSCSQAGVTSSDDTASQDDYHEARDAPAEASTSKAKPKVKNPKAGDVTNKEVVENSGSRGRIVAEDIDESEWQLVSEQDMTMTVGSDQNKNSVLLPLGPLPSMSEPSCLLAPDFRSLIHQALPLVSQGRQWVLLYSTQRDGMSLQSLYRKTARSEGPCLLVTGDREGAVFGGLHTSSFQVSQDRYQGTNSSFVFTNVSGKLKIFRPTGVNSYYVLCGPDSLAFGGGTKHFALALDAELLNGTSGPSETFGSYCLAHSQEFVAKDVEVWGFEHVSRSSAQKAHREPPGVWRLHL